MKSLAMLVGSFLLALLDGFLGWLLLETTFQLGFWVWVGICFVGIQVARSGQIMQDIYQALDK